jgi:hypothetical protein
MNQLLPTGVKSSHLNPGALASAAVADLEALARGVAVAVDQS